MTVALVRVDDRLVHGQVVIGWGRPLHAAFVAVVDDTLAGSEWEQELYRMGVPPDVTLEFVTVADAAARRTAWEADPRAGIILLGDVTTVLALADAGVRFPKLNLGGVHHRAGRTERLPYVFLSDAELRTLGELAASGTEITAQDLPATRPVPLEALR